MKMYNEIKVKSAGEFASTLRNMIKWSMFGNENIIHFYQPDGVNDEINIDHFKTYTIGCKMSGFEFDNIGEIVVDMHKPLFLIECNTEGKIWVIKPNKINMTKFDLASRLDFANEINIKGFCNIRTKEQVINAYISNTCFKFM